MPVITTYPDDAELSDSDKFSGPDSSGSFVLYPASLVKKYLGDGLTPATDSWSYASYSSGVGVINANSGANTRYTIGQWIKFNQPTLGVKWAKIESLATSTITARFLGGTTLDNEAITNPYYSASFAPLGSPITNSVGPEMLSTRALYLGSASVTSNASTASTTPVAIAGLSVTATVPSGSRRTKLTVSAESITVAAGNTVTISLWEGTVGSGTKLKQVINFSSSGAQTQPPLCLVHSYAATAGSKTWNVGIQTSSGSFSAIMTAAAGSPAELLVENL